MTFVSGVTAMVLIPSQVLHFHSNKQWGEPIGTEVLTVTETKSLLDIQAIRRQSA